MKNQPLARGTKQDFSTIIQLKLGHGYFKSYLKRLPKYQNDFCFPACRRTQDSRHLIMNCKVYRQEQKEFKQEILKTTVPWNLEAILTLKEGQRILSQYLRKTKIATRKWILGEAIEKEEREEEWVRIEEVEGT